MMCMMSLRHAKMLILYFFLLFLLICMSKWLIGFLQSPAARLTAIQQPIAVLLVKLASQSDKR